MSDLVLCRLLSQSCPRNHNCKYIQPHIKDNQDRYGQNHPGNIPRYIWPVSHRKHTKIDVASITHSKPSQFDGFCPDSTTKRRGRCRRANLRVCEYAITDRRCTCEALINEVRLQRKREKSNEVSTKSSSKSKC